MRVLLVSLVLAVATLAQTPAEIYAYEEYQAWAAKQKPGDDLLDRYKAHLIAGGADSVDAEDQVRAIRRRVPSPLLVEKVKGMKAGRALVVGDGPDAEWLREQGWTVTVVKKLPESTKQWDLVVEKGKPR